MRSFHWQGLKLYSPFSGDKKPVTIQGTGLPAIFENKNVLPYPPVSAIPKVLYRTNTFYKGVIEAIMKKRVICKALLFSTILPLATISNTYAQVESTPADSSTSTTESAAESNPFWNTYIEGHLQLGTRSVYRVLTDGDSGHKGGYQGDGTFLGTIYGLEENQNMLPTALTLAYYFNKYLGVQLAYDSISAETRAIDIYTGLEKTDGDVNLSGPTISLLARYTNSTPVTPYIGVGLGFYSASFDADPNWSYNPRHEGHVYNHMDVESVVGIHFLAGADWLFYENWALNLTIQYTKADVDAAYDRYYDGELTATQEGHFPMDNVAIGLGVSYHF